MMSRFAILCLAFTALPCAERACAQTVGNQTFRVRVPDVVSMEATTESVSITHNLKNQNQRFPDQVWTASSRNANGAVVTFQTNQAFTNVVDPNAKRNARLVLRNSPSPWRVTQRRDETDYESGDEVAAVSAESDQAANGVFQLRVTFLNESANELLPGDYEMTVTGTIISK